MPARGEGNGGNGGGRSSGASRSQGQAVPAPRYSLNCFDPRYPLGYPLKRSGNFSKLRELCDAENARCLEEGTFVQFWIVANGRYVYPPEFSSAFHTTTESTDGEKICPRGAA